MEQAQLHKNYQGSPKVTVKLTKPVLFGLQWVGLICSGSER